MAATLSARQYASLRKVSHTAVLKAIQSGRISTNLDGKIDPDVANREWDQNTDWSKKRETPVEDAEGDAKSYASSRAQKEKYSARMSRLEYEEKAGKLVDAEEVKRQAFNAARITRDAILNVPNKISHELAAETDPAKVHLLLTKSLHSALTELVNLGEKALGTDPED